MQPTVHDESAGRAGIWVLLAAGVAGLVAAAMFAGWRLTGSLTLLADFADKIHDTALYLLLAGALAFIGSAASWRPRWARPARWVQHRLDAWTGLLTATALAAFAFFVAWSSVAGTGSVPDGRALLAGGALGVAVYFLIRPVIRRAGTRHHTVRAISAHLTGDLWFAAFEIAAGALLLWTAWAPWDRIGAFAGAVLMLRAAADAGRRAWYAL